MINNYCAAWRYCGQYWLRYTSSPEEFLGKSPAKQAIKRSWLLSPWLLTAQAVCMPEEPIIDRLLCLVRILEVKTGRDQSST